MPVCHLAGAGPCALLLHAGGERWDVWRPVMTRLAENGFSSVAFDQRGHGERRADPGETLAAFGEDAAAVIAGLTSPVVVGASLGGFAALTALGADDVRVRVAGLVLVDVVPDPDPTVVREFLGRTRAPLARFPVTEDILGHATALRRIASRLDLPVLLVRAGRSSPLNDEGAARFVELVPHASVVTIRGAGHLVARDCPDDLATVLMDFLSLDTVRDRKILRFLDEHGAEAIEHPGGTLARHLWRTADTLRAWQAPTWLVDAARLHAAYGTDGFGVPLVESRPAVEEVVGVRAEALIRLYCGCDRDRSYPTWGSGEPLVFDRTGGATTRLDATARSALMELTVANELDVMAHDPEIASRYGPLLRKLFTGWAPFLSRGANEALSRNVAAAATT